VARPNRNVHHLRKDLHIMAKSNVNLQRSRETNVVSLASARERRSNAVLKVWYREMGMAIGRVDMLALRGQLKGLILIVDTGDGYPTSESIGSLEADSTMAMNAALRVAYDAAGQVGA
jgi:hypothetical protein